MKYQDLVEEVKAEMMEEKKDIAKEEIREKLVEIEVTENVLAEMKEQLETMLDREI